MMGSKLKAFLRAVEARTHADLLTAIAHGLQTITPKDATNWFAH